MFLSLFIAVLPPDLLEDPAITLLGYQVQSKMLNNQTTHCMVGTQRSLSDKIDCEFCIILVVVFCQDTNLVLGEFTQICYFVYSMVSLWFAYPFSEFALQKPAASSPNLVANPEAEITA